MKKRLSVLVIGAGPAGEKAALEAASLGARVTVVERSSRPGGASVISGTLPSKSLIETAHYVEVLREKDLSGFDVDVDILKNISVHKLMHRKNVVTAARVEDIMYDFRKAGVRYVNGEASFVDANHLLIKSQHSQDIVLEADRIIIAGGTKPYHPPDIEFDREFILDSDGILEMDKIPQKLAIFGGGVIGCEYASIFGKLGTEVELIDPRGKLLDFLDHEISMMLANLMQAQGIILRLGEQYEAIFVENRQVHIHTKSGRRIVTDKLLYANGRQGMAELLKLEAVGLKMNHRSQLDVNGNYQTNLPHIYGVGDIIGAPSLVSVSNEEGRLAARHAVTGEDSKHLTADIPCGIYTIPEIAAVGKTEGQLISEGVDYGVGVCHFKDLARGLIIGGKHGILKLLFNVADRRLLGVHIIGHSASELVHIGHAVLGHQGTLDFFIDNVFNFPTLASAYKVAARDGISRLK